ncbi:hypothetical protein A9P82_07675 [Arachidicoccus ginsenosidimutans]|uniref:TlpA family protein disulfide reductase n=1 Tax=Arachidicoccus sp. BS20 TaxID=1850526 RepID=UPI0007F10A09|nr:TlpA disulfide reductase family protein [Arachidicoccus sp. BS20]ANI89180.1 hypothetical protein A9P82_07675 [Arachidicoccus sp. BS20]
MKLKTSIAAMLFIIIVGTSSACSFNSNSKNNNNSTKDTSFNTQSVANKNDASDIVFRDTKGKEISLSSLKGKVVFINFWATWCPPCKREIPSINQLKKSFEGNDNIVFLMVDVDKNLTKSSKYMKNHDYDLSVYAAQSQIPPTFLENAIPTTVIIDKSGKMVGRVEGAADYSAPQVHKKLEDLIQNS